LAYIYKYYSLVTIIVSNRSPQFISAFWEKFCRLLDTKLKLFITYYLQTNRQTENANQ
jgi:hypothetical protein